MKTKFYLHLALITAGVLPGATPCLAQSGSLVFSNAAFLGGTTDQRGTAISISGGAAYVSGLTSANGQDGVVASYALPLVDGAAPTWSTIWPSLTGFDGFSGIGVSTGGVYLAGYSYGRTVDSFGDKENKGIVVKFPLSGPTGGGFGGDIWDRQTPPPPGVWSYSGGEGLTSMSLASENGTNFIYASGSGEPRGFTSRSFLLKLSENGDVLWTQTDLSEQVVNAASAAQSMTLLNSSIYVAGQTYDSGAWNAYLRKYTPAGDLVWKRTSAVGGQYRGVTALAGAIFTVGSTGLTGASADFLIEKWDESGNKLWSRTYDRNAQEDILNGIVDVRGHLFAVGSTRGTTAGSVDAIILEIDPASGDLLASTLYGGSADDVANAAATDGNDLYVLGETRSFGNGSNQVMLLRYSVRSLSLNMYAGLTITGPVGQQYRVEYQNALGGTNAWQTLTNLTLPYNPYLLIDVDSPNARNRFYRAVPLP